MRLLAIIPDASGARGCLEAAAAAASIDPAAHIEVLHVKVEPLVAGRIDDEVAMLQARDHYEGTADLRARATWAEFEAWCSSVAPEVAQRLAPREITGREEDTVLHESWSTDLMVMARPHDMDGHDALHAAIFRSHKPLLLVPGDWTAEAAGRLERHMLIAWKPTEQAHRAVAGARPWLCRADKVTVLTVSKHGQAPDPGELLDLLSSEGIEPETVTAEAIDGRTSARILATAADRGASCLVMGAYRHGPIVEWAMGATTRRVFAQTPLPVFVAH